MSFDRTKAAAASHTGDEVQEDLNQGDEGTPTGAGQPDNSAPEPQGTPAIPAVDNQTPPATPAEETPEQLKERLKKAEEDRDNYKQGMLAAKAANRSTTPPAPVDTTPPAVDPTEELVNTVLEKRNEREVLKQVVDSKSAYYIPELVPDDQYSEIIGYLPMNLDKSSPEKIVKALKVATKLWKEDRGIVDKPVDQTKKVQADLATTRTTASGGDTPPPAKKSGRNFIKSNVPMSEWYKKK